VPLHACLRQLTQWLDPQLLLTLAQESGFARRTARKLTPLLLVQATVLLVSQSTVSLRRWAALVGVLGQLCLSKQALWERLTPRASVFLQAVLAQLLAGRLHLNRGAKPAALAAFPRVLVQDSTTIKLTPKLAAAFPGSRNQRGANHGQLKIQALYDLLAQRFVSFRLSGFNRNDQAAAPDVLPHLRPGDLVVRDLGYFVVASLAQMLLAGAFFLSRLRLDTGLVNARTGQPLNLLGALKRHGQFDGEVLLGAAQLRVRLVAVKLPEAVAAERRRKAKQNRDRRCRPNARHLALLGWAIFVTNVPRKVWRARTVAQVYGLRWRSETIFKAWKSHFRLTEVPRGSAAQLEAMIYARLIFVTIFARTGVVGEGSAWQAESPPPFSLLKLAGLVGDFFLILCLEAWHRPVSDSWLRQLHYHGRYERRTRKHFVQTFMKLS
jgi:Transposase DDE domain